MHISTDPWVWVAAILTLAIFTFLYKDNPLFKFAEHLFVGVATGYGLVIIYFNAFKPNLYQPLFVEHNLLYIIPFFFGILYFSAAIPKFSYMMRWPIALLLGIGSGLSIPLTFQTYIVEHTKSTILRFPYPNTVLFINALILFIGVLTVLIYFYFSYPHKGAIGTISRIGIIFIMIGFGASFGYTVMARFSLLVGRIQFLLGQWLGIHTVM